MYKAKTKPTKTGPKTYLEAIVDDVRRKDCKDLAALMKRVTGCSAKMWGPSIVGFGTYHFKYESGHEGDSPVAGFSSRKSDITIYLAAGHLAKAGALLGKLGKHKAGKGCLYLKRLSDVEMPVLERLIKQSVADIRSR
ncbi:MAG TPA: DUF1801 domain-containing protein [Opitutaceae bacterium]|jgi:hypothetical protein|nr:DUF1801 domain-containing protein [Opitutaceae bacterium]